MNISKIKYHIAVAAVMTAAAFCGCNSEAEEMIRLDGFEAVESSPNDRIENTSKENRSDNTSDERSHELIKVYVCGAVKSPDVYTLPNDVRVVDAVNAAGGFAADAGYEYLNLAAPLSDGQKVYIPTKEEIEEALAEGEELYGKIVNITSNTPGITTGNNSPEDGNGKVNINSADKELLMTLPGIGQSKADKIIAYREANGAFSSIEDLMLVGGIKEGLFNKVKDSICVK